MFEYDINPFCQEVSTGYLSTKITVEASVDTAKKCTLPSQGERRTAKRIRVKEFPGLYFRKILPVDRQQIQRLHEEWFPVEYQETFYDTLVYGKLITPRHDRRPVDESDLNGEDELTRPLFTYLACVDQSIDFDSEQHSEAKEDSGDFCTVKLVSMEEARRDIGQDEDGCADSSEGHRIAACIVGAKVEPDVLPPNLRHLLVPRPHIHSKLFYIMTLGTAEDYRSMGLASYLVLQCIEQEIENDESCGTLYLHVLDTNYAAIRFYEKLGFYCVRLIPNYYTIDGKLRHCYLYAKYFHGNTGHLTLLDMLKKGLHSLWRTLVRVPWDQSRQRPSV